VVGVVGVVGWWVVLFQILISIVLHCYMVIAMHCASDKLPRW